MSCPHPPPQGPVEEALVACLGFLACEQAWESFRADTLYFDAQVKKTASERNAERLHRFLRDLAAKDARVAQLLALAVNL